VSSKRGSYSREFKEAAVREVIDQSRPIADVARQFGLVEQTLGNRVKVYRAEHVGDGQPELSLSERTRLRELDSWGWSRRWPGCRCRTRAGS
jgi:transposase